LKNGEIKSRNDLLLLKAAMVNGCHVNEIFRRIKLHASKCNIKIEERRDFDITGKLFLPMQARCDPKNGNSYWVALVDGRVDNSLK
jgi:hypothetical protein